MEDLKQELKNSVEVYLAFCAEKGREPKKPYSGKLSIRTRPEIHRRIALEAARRRVNERLRRVGPGKGHVRGLRGARQPSCQTARPQIEDFLVTSGVRLK